MKLGEYCADEWSEERPEGARPMDRTELLESALTALPDGIALFGVEGQVAFWNHAAEAITGYAGIDIVAERFRKGRSCRRRRGCCS